MEAFLTIFGYFLKLAPGIVLGIQTIKGEAASNTDKKKMASDALAIATATALGSLTGSNAVLAQAAAILAGHVIDATVTSTKADGTYQAATEANKLLPASAA